MDCLNKQPNFIQQLKVLCQQFVPIRLKVNLTNHKAAKIMSHQYTLTWSTPCVKDRFQTTSFQKVFTIVEEHVNTVNLEKTWTFANNLDSDRLSLHLSMLGDISKEIKIPLTKVWEIEKLLMYDNAVWELSFRSWWLCQAPLHSACVHQLLVV